MSETTEPSMYRRPESTDDWPVTAIPRPWVEKIFATMSACYGARFADLWRGTEVEHVKRLWGVELGKLSAAQLRAGRENLAALGRPPTLPEFIAHCRQARIERLAATQHACLTDDRRAAPEVAAAGVARIRDAAQQAVPQAAGTGWAFDRLLEDRARNGAPMTARSRDACIAAILSPAGRAYAQTQPPERAAACRALIERHQPRRQEAS